MRRKDEYDEIYSQSKGFGFEYTYKNHGLGREKIINQSDVRKIGASKHNDDKTFIRCGRCNVYMDYIHSLRNSFSGKWICPNCGTYVRETTVNRYIGELEPLIEEDNDYDEFY